MRLSKICVFVPCTNMLQFSHIHISKKKDIDKNILMYAYLPIGCRELFVIHNTYDFTILNNSCSIFDNTFYIERNTQ